MYTFYLVTLIQILVTLIKNWSMILVTFVQQMSTELIERAIFAMESAFHPLFSVVAGNCRLEYRRQENR